MGDCELGLAALDDAACGLVVWAAALFLRLVEEAEEEGAGELEAEWDVASWSEWVKRKILVDGLHCLLDVLECELLADESLLNGWGALWEGGHAGVSSLEGLNNVLVVDADLEAGGDNADVILTAVGLLEDEAVLVLLQEWDLDLGDNVCLGKLDLAVANEEVIHVLDAALASLGVCDVEEGIGGKEEVGHISHGACMDDVSNDASSVTNLS